MKFSVIVTFYNEKPYIEKCIQALENQDLDREDYELIFIDNGSTDGSGEIVGKFPDIILLEEWEGHTYVSRNKGLSMAKGEIIAFTDADCVPESNWLRMIKERMAENKCDIVLGRRRLGSRRSFLRGLVEDFANTQIEYIINFKDKKYVYAYANNMALRSNVFRDVGGFDEALERGGDTELMMRLLAAGRKVSYLPGMVVTHLEINTIFDWMKKHFVYGKSSVKIAAKSYYSPIKPVDNLSVFRIASSKERFIFLRVLALLPVLLLGNMFFIAGRMAGKIGLRAENKRLCDGRK